MDSGSLNHALGLIATASCGWCLCLRTKQVAVHEPFASRSEAASLGLKLHWSSPHLERSR